MSATVEQIREMLRITDVTCVGCDDQEALPGQKLCADCLAIVIEDGIYSDPKHSYGRPS